MANVIQFAPKAVNILWAPSKRTKASWRVLSQSSVVSFRTATPATEEPASFDETTVEGFARSVLHRIESRFGETLPKGGCTAYLQTERRDWIDTYGRGNFHNSVHQFKGPEDDWNRLMPFPVWLPDAVARMSGRRKRFNVGLKSDPFQWLDLKYAVTKRLLIEANRLGVKLKFHTMSDLCAHEDYRQLLKDGGHTVVMHMGVNDDRAERLLSPGAPSCKRRQTAVNILKDCGIDVKVKKVGIAKFKQALLKKGFYPNNKAAL